MKMELIWKRFLSRIWVEGGIHQIDGWCNSHPTEQHTHNFSLNWIECPPVTDGPGDFSSSSLPPLESGQSQILPLIVEAEMSANVPTRMRIVIIITLGRVIPLLTITQSQPDCGHSELLGLISHLIWNETKMSFSMSLPISCRVKILHENQKKCESIFCLT